MKLTERRGEYLITPDTSREMAALEKLAGRQIEVRKSGSHLANHSLFLGRTQSMASAAE